MISQNIGLIGAGQMATALAAGWVRGGLIDAQRLVVSDPYAAALERFDKIVPGTRIAADNASVVAAAEIVFLAVKPQMVAGVLGELKAMQNGRSVAEPLFVSIVAGWKIERLEQALTGSRWIRVMPNTPCLVGESAMQWRLEKTSPTLKNRPFASCLTARASLGNWPNR
ncbi:MAG: NAD(P)-binding domain-containing protein [Pirellulales bacterium]